MVRARLDALTERSLTAHPAAKWVLSGNTGEIKAARKGTGHPTSHADGSGEVSSLTGTPLSTKVYGTTCIDILKNACYLGKSLASLLAEHPVTPSP